MSTSIIGLKVRFTKTPYHAKGSISLMGRTGKVIGYQGESVAKVELENGKTVMADIYEDLEILESAKVMCPHCAATFELSQKLIIKES